MPLSFDISRLDRIAIGVARGSLTVAEMQDFYERLVTNEALNYRKIIDIADARTEMRKSDIARFAEWVNGRFPDRPAGAIAIVADERGEELALLFAQLVAGKQPAKVFRSLHAARQWLRDTAAIDLRTVR